MDIPYDQLVFAMGHLSTVCAEFWPAEGYFHPWGAIFIADWLRGYATDAQLAQLLPMIKSDYMGLAQCIVDSK